ncbi:MAG: hypothetical protein WCX73_05255 [Candidatus Pacearchaeota archaeon]|jgi:hypothetical protein
MATISCDNCDKIFERQYKREIRKSHNFCSLECARAYRKKYKIGWDSSNEILFRTRSNRLRVGNSY